MVDPYSNLAGERAGELIAPDDANRAGEMARQGELRRVAAGVYTDNLSEPLDRVTRRNWLEVLRLKYPGSVLVGRSAVLSKPTDDGHIYLDAGPRKSLDRTEIGPLSLMLRPGSGPLEGDVDIAGVYLSSRARAAMENLIPSRSSSGPSWTLTDRELEDWLSGLADRHGEEELNRIRDDARRIAEDAGGGWPKLSDELNSRIGAILGTRDAVLSSPRAAARRGGTPYDGARVERFDVLRNRLLVEAPGELSKATAVSEVSAFYEAYFSNFIEGTEFTVGEAEEIVFDGMVPADRPEDAHDVIGTFRAIVDERRNALTPSSPDELIDIARSLNATVLEQRPEKLPGEFKKRANQAGSTLFVVPELVEGTLRAGWSYYESLPRGFARATFMMFLVAEVHPFTDGNGRTARLMMNAELTAAGLGRFIVPISYREDYLGALRALSHNDNPDPLARMVSRILRWVGAVDWSTVDSARAELEEVRAFDAGPDARLRIP